MKRFSLTMLSIFALLFTPMIASLPRTYLPMHCYYTTGVSAYGDSLELQNGTLFKIAVDQAHSVLNWHREDPLIISQNTNWFFYRDYSYKIYNDVTKETVYANLHLAPFVHSPDTRFIKAIHHNYGELLLDNHLKWKIASHDISKIQEWLQEDAILIGINAGPNSRKYPYILINATINSHVRAKEF